MDNAKEQFYKEKIAKFEQEIAQIRQEFEQLKQVLTQPKSPVMTADEVYEFFGGAFSLYQIKRGLHGFDKCLISKPTEKLRFSRRLVERLKLQKNQSMAERASVIVGNSKRRVRKSV